MKRYVIVHTSTSIGGRTSASRSRPKGAKATPDHDGVHEELGEP